MSKSNIKAVANLNATTDVSTMTKTQLIALISDKNDALRVALSTKRTRVKEKELYSEKCKNENSFHFSMRMFKSVITDNIDKINKSLIVSNDADKTIITNEATAKFKDALAVVVKQHQAEILEFLK